MLLATTFMEKTLTKYGRDSALLRVYGQVYNEMCRFNNESLAAVIRTCPNDSEIPESVKDIEKATTMAWNKAKAAFEEIDDDTDCAIVEMNAGFMHRHLAYAFHKCQPAKGSSEVDAQCEEHARYLSALYHYEKAIEYGKGRDVAYEAVWEFCGVAMTMASIYLESPPLYVLTLGEVWELLKDNLLKAVDFIKAFPASKAKERNAHWRRAQLYIQLGQIYAKWCQVKGDKDQEPKRSQRRELAERYFKDAVDAASASSFPHHWGVADLAQIDFLVKSLKGRESIKAFYGVFSAFARIRPRFEEDDYLFEEENEEMHLLLCDALKSAFMWRKSRKKPTENLKKVYALALQSAKKSDQAQQIIATIEEASREVLSWKKDENVSKQLYESLCNDTN